MVEAMVLHMLQRCLPYVEESTSWIISTGWYVVEDDNDFRWRRM